MRLTEEGRKKGTGGNVVVDAVVDANQSTTRMWPWRMICARLDPNTSDATATNVASSRPLYYFINPHQDAKSIPKQSNRVTITIIRIYI